MILETLFERARAAKRPVFIPYLMAGDPDLATTQAMIKSLHAAGADFLELGVPYGDPLADGPVIAAAGARALRKGVAISDVFALAKAAPLPVVLFSYYNPVLQYGLERFASDAHEAGVAGVIVPDLPLEEATVLGSLLGARDLAMPLLVAPTTAMQRAKRIADQATGFIYVVSRLGVTGAGVAPDFAPLIAHLRELRAITEKPLAVGFGLSTQAQMREMSQYADGLIVGSALIEAYQRPGQKSAAAKVAEFAAQIRS